MRANHVGAVPGTFCLLPIPVINPAPLGPVQCNVVCAPGQACGNFKCRAWPPGRPRLQL